MCGLLYLATMIFCSQQYALSANTVLPLKVPVFGVKDIENGGV